MESSAESIGAMDPSTIALGFAVGLIAIGVGSAAAKRASDTKEFRAAVLDKLNSNPGIPGAGDLAQWLVVDGFLLADGSFDGTSVPLSDSDRITLGRGTGRVVWTSALTTLKSFNAAGGGHTISAAVDKAIAGTPTGDDPDSRSAVMGWVKDAARFEGFAQLYDDLSAGAWATGTYIEPAKPPPIRLHLSAEGRSTTIHFYGAWLKRLTTRELLSKIEPLLHPRDPSEPDRLLAQLNIASILAAPAQENPPPGFDELRGYLTDAGFYQSPLVWTDPPPNATIESLGGLQNVDVTTALRRGTRSDRALVAAIRDLIRRAQNSWSPGWERRTEALAALKTAQNDAWGHYFENFDVVYAALVAAGFGDAVRGRRTIPNGSVTYLLVKGIAYIDVVGGSSGYGTLQDFVERVDADDVFEIAQTVTSLKSADDPALYRWLCYQSSANLNLFYSNVSTGTLQPGVSVCTAATVARELESVGWLFNPPRFSQQIDPNLTARIAFSPIPTMVNNKPYTGAEIMQDPNLYVRFVYESLQASYAGATGVPSQAVTDADAALNAANQPAIGALGTSVKKYLEVFKYPALVYP